MLLPTSRAARTILGRNQRPTAKATPSNASRVTWLAISEGERSTKAMPTRAATRIAHLVAPGLVCAVDPWKVRRRGAEPVLMAVHRHSLHR